MKPATTARDEAGRKLRGELVTALRRLDALGLNRGTTGNLSHRAEGGFWITPTGIETAQIGIDDWVRIGSDGQAQGRWQPSSETPFHRAVYAARADVQAVVHCHSVHATAVACLRRDLPPFHYMVAIAGGDSVPCVPYHLFGSDELSAAVAAALTRRDACLLANHGLIACGRSLAQAMKVALEVESLCEVYLKALAVGTPVELDAREMAQVIEKFRTYGQPQVQAAARSQ
jgi:L-fuculose-phosphate aldolase